MASIEKLDVLLEGIGHVLLDKKICIPPHQRSYAWDKEHIEDMLKDLNDSISSRSKYFLGTIVLTDGNDGFLNVIDGQQRLTTCSIVYSSIRDYFRETGDVSRSEGIHSSYLAKKDLRSQESIQNLKLSEKDNPFYLDYIIENNKDTLHEHEKLVQAKCLSDEFIKNVVAQTQDPASKLVDWVEHIRDNVNVIVVKVAKDQDAFTIFEVLNDRGLDLTVSDLLKNFLYQKSGDRVEEVKFIWHEILSNLEPIGSNDILTDFIRHVWSSRHGLTREKVLFDSIKHGITSKAEAVDFAKRLKQLSIDYAGLYNPDYQKWIELGPDISDAIRSLNIFKVSQIRPLILAILSKFDQGEIKKSFKMFESWSVRFLIAGKTGSGNVEKLYSDASKNISSGKINNANELWEHVKKTIPSDQEFKEAFAKASASNAALARYYLMKLNNSLMGPECITNKNPNLVNLEHILPKTLQDTWPNFTESEHKSFYKRIGNLTLIDVALNSRAGNDSYVNKKSLYQSSQILLTSQIPEKFDDWNVASIDARQSELSNIAVNVWKASP